MAEVTGRGFPRAATGLEPAAAPVLPFRQLEIFHAIMETGSVSAASRVLGISQPSLSRSLHRLEDQLRLDLFQRHRKRLVPTSEAHRLYDVVAPAVRQMRAITASVAKIAEGQTSLFRFAATQSVVHALVPRAIRAMRQKAPELRIFLDAITRSQHAEYLISSQGECILSLAEVDHPLISSREIARAPLVALVRTDHPLSVEPCVSPKALLGHPLILFEHSGPHSVAIDAFFAGHDRPPAKTFIRFSDAALGLAAEGVGVALVDGFTAMGWLPQGVVRVPLFEPPLFTARLYTNNERPGSRFVELLGDTLAGLTAEGRHD